jgi:hypothetical protein
VETLEIIGADRYRLVLFGTKVQQRLSMSRTKDSQNQNGDNSLDGLVIDWQFANTERMFNDFVEPVMDYQPTYAYA